MAELISRSQELEKNIITIVKEKGQPGKINGIDSRRLKTEAGQFTVFLDKKGLPNGAIFEQRDGEKLTFYYDGAANGPSTDGNGRPDGLPEKIVNDNQPGGLKNSYNKRSAEGTLDAITPMNTLVKTAPEEAGLSPRKVNVLGIERDKEGNVISMDTVNFENGETAKLDGEIEQKIAAQTIQEEFRNGLSKFNDGLK